ncbi:S-layer homology domain-containing protein [Paenibacillus sp. CAU 1782]
MKSIHLRVCTVLILVLVSLSLLEVNVHGEEEDPSWSTQWMVNLEKHAGKTIYNPVFPQFSSDGTTYLKLAPDGKGIDYADYIAISPNGDVKWTYRSPIKNLEYMNTKPFEVDALGNLYLHYFSEDSGLTVHKIGPNGKLLKKYALPDAKEKKNGLQLRYQDDGTVRLAQTYENGDVKLFLLTKDGEVSWSKKVKTDYTQGWADLMTGVNFVGDNFLVHQAKTVELFDKKGNKLFKRTKPDNEWLTLNAASDGHFIGTSIIIDPKQGNKTISKRLVGFDRSGKQLWSIKLADGALLFQLQDHFIYTVTDDANWITKLIKVDPSNGKTLATYTPKKFLMFNNENYSNFHRDYYNDPFFDITQFSGYGVKEPQRTLLDPATLKEIPIVFETVWAESGHIRASMQELYRQQNGETFAILWNGLEVRKMVLHSAGDGLNSGQSPSALFKDVQHHWAREAIELAVKEKVISGYSDGTFRPDQNVTMPEFLTILLRSYGVMVESSKPGQPWYDGVISYAKEKNWNVGDQLTQPITRGQVARLIVNTAGENYNLNDSITYVLHSGIASGKTDKTIAGYQPQDRLTRAEAVVLIANIKTKLSELKEAPIEESAASPH